MLGIDRTGLDLFLPSGEDKQHTCMECKHCYSRLPILGESSHCDELGNEVDGNGFACGNCFEQYADKHTNHKF